MLYIRADGNAEIGTGHIMRCLSIATAMRRSDGDCTFITADTKMKPLIEEKRFPVVCLDSVWNNLDSETEKMEILITERKIGKLLIDSYFVTPNYLKSLQKMIYVAYIDDLNAFQYSCDMLINYNIYAEKFNYPASYPDTELLIECQYAPLREEFQNLPCREVQKDVKSILITVGGVDLLNVAGKLVSKAKTLPELKHIEFHIVAGALNSHIEDLEQLVRKHEGIFIHSDVKEMSQLMLDCDIAVSAGGSTLYELCACGTPTVVFALADNQIDAATSFGQNCMIDAGDIRTDEELCLKKILGGLKCLISDYKLRCDMPLRMQELVDGRGADRIAEAICDKIKRSHPLSHRQT